MNAESHRRSKSADVPTILGLAGKIRHFVVISANADDGVRAEVLRILRWCLKNFLKHCHGPHTACLVALHGLSGNIHAPLRHEALAMHWMGSKR